MSRSGNELLARKRASYGFPSFHHDICPLVGEIYSSVGLVWCPVRRFAALNGDESPTGNFRFCHGDDLSNFGYVRIGKLLVVN